MKPARLILIAICTFALSPGQTSAQAVDTKSITVQDILKSWKARQERVRSFSFTWTQRRTYSKGALLGPKSPPKKNPEGLTVPAEPETRESSYKLIVDGNRFRLDQDTVIVNLEQGIIPQRFLSVANGATTKYFTPKGGAPYPSGAVTKEKLPTDNVRDTMLIPLLFTYRGAHPNLAPRPEKEFLSQFSIISREAMIGDRRTFALKGSIAGLPTGGESFWVDPERDFIVLRYVSTDRGNPVIQIEFDSYKRESEEWILAGWKEVWLNNDGSMRTTTDARVTAYSLNTMFDDKEFDLEFPYGTWVIENTSTTKGQDEISYIVKEGGRKRLITRGERFGTSYEDLLNSESGMALRQPKTSPAQWLQLLMYGSGIALSVGLGLYGYRRITRFRKGSGSGA